MRRGALARAVRLLAEEIAAAVGSPSDPLAAYYDSNNVWIPLKNGTVQRIGMDTGIHPWRNQYVAGPGNFGLDASLFKTIKSVRGPRCASTPTSSKC